mmetsp:Transcript_52574/g.125202  ORF Transcript_52574/g.125202 Transcript_52574/m.125202 type:complete len:201 (+) Transcript_52574:95-697(+)
MVSSTSSRTAVLSLPLLLATFLQLTSAFSTAPLSPFLRRAVVTGGPRSFQRASVLWQPRAAACTLNTRMALTPEQEVEFGRICKELQVVFKKYDKNKDGHLTMMEYNQWQTDAGKSYKIFLTANRFDRFCSKSLGSDPKRGMSYDGLVKLYSTPDQISRGSSALASSSSLLAAAFVVCVALSVPYYLPSCTEYCRTLPFL